MTSPAVQYARAVALLGVLLLVAPGPRATGAASGKDKALYYEAKSSHGKLRRSGRQQSKIKEWERVILRYRRVVARYPRSPYCDNALLAVGNLYGEMSTRFGQKRFAKDAVKAYRMLVREYPSSSLRDGALHAVVVLAREHSVAGGAKAAGRAYLAAFPKGQHVRAVKQLMRPPKKKTASPSRRSTGLASVKNLRFWSGKTSTRVVLDLDRKVAIRYDRINAPDRLWVDLSTTQLDPGLKDRAFPLQDGMLEQVRIGQNRPGVVRVVLDFGSATEHNIFFLPEPARLVIDVTRSSGSKSRAAHKTAGAPSSRGKVQPPASGSRRASTEPVQPVVPPRPNRDGSLSLSRQLGLGARRIVIDPGHGGRDPGTIGRRGLQEKELVLDVALRLAKLVRSQVGAEVVLTRASDVYIPLEERTAIANSRGADLFLSIHANSARNRKARGIETYFLSFAKNAHAEAVAARENAISAGTLKDLQGLVKAITLNSKIDESRDFASSIQEGMVSGLKRHYSDVRNRGVHTAPFYVLIGANMPSVLAEVAFVSHPREERRLKTSVYRDRIAQGLLKGVRRYLDALNQTQTRQLARRPAERTRKAARSR